MFLLSLMDKRMQYAMIQLSQFPGMQLAVHYNSVNQLTFFTKKLISFYISFFQRLEFLPTVSNYYKRKILKDVEFTNTDEIENDLILKRIMKQVKVKAHTSGPNIHQQIIPIHLHLFKTSEITLLSGIAISEPESNYLRLILHELSLPRNSMHISQGRLHYLQESIEVYSSGDYKDLRDLARYYQIDYQQFQKDCKNYFGCTFYQFYTKMKMINAVEDILFSNKNFKEISASNGFTDYSNMYKIFNVKYSFPLDKIPRFLFDK